MKYHLNIIEEGVELPPELQIEYTDLDFAYSALCDFVHSFDGKLQVDGRVVDEDGEDVEYSSSLM